MADGEPPSWADLPAEIVRAIGSHLLCEIDHLCAQALCRSWLAAFLPLGPAPPPLPWLVVPRAGQPAFHCVPSNWRTQRFFVPPGARQVRYFGSYDGAWFFLSVSQADRQILRSLHNYGQSIRLPNAHRQFRLGPGALQLIPEQDRIVIVAATLSHQPTEQGCVAAGIIGFHRFPHDPRHISWKWRTSCTAMEPSTSSPEGNTSVRFMNRYSLSDTTCRQSSTSNRVTRTTAGGRSLRATS
ncbi:hypothetical protein E2562_001035 [Oryza meyeriana var. granulata]|uniref:DUF295 domain-containing protein n=1 Tax=Oryza meyeriana var. granulata TaxID=110450 RepID=A0A6G1EDG3_9ORYZ|nr:hypothetical protein E2562_001035 [Oryza meyeriana var. granulata]